MRIFQALFRRKNMPNGNIWHGKHRLVKQPQWKDIQKLRNDFEIEEKNMFYLRHPYLTPQQSSGHWKALGRKEELNIKLITQKKDFKENVTIEARLAHLRHKEVWD